MKNYLYLLGGAFLLINATSCKKVLDKEVLGTQNTTSLYADSSSAVLGINAIYDVISWSCDWNSATEIMEWTYGDVLSNDAEKGSTTGDYATLAALKSWSADASNTPANYLYTVLYQAIYRANVAIQELEAASWSSDLKNRLLAEAHFLRGYSYFYLLRLYGGVPLVTTPLAITEMNVQRSTFSQTAALVEADFLYAENILPVKSAYTSANLGRATKGAAQAYLSRVYMYELGTDNTLAHTWLQVYNLTDTIISSGEYSLYSNYAALTQEVSENGVESVFELQYSESTNYWGASSLGTYNNIYQMNRNTWGWGFNNPTTSLYNEFETNDPRRACTMYGSGDTIVGVVQTISYPTENSTGYLNAKAAIVQPSVPAASGQNTRKIRYADVLLMHAEAAAHLGYNSEAATYVNMIRARAKASTRPMGTNVNYPTAYATATVTSSTLPDISSSLSTTAMLTAIMHERRVEFGMEALHFWDMVRTGTYLDSLSTTVKTKCLTHCITSGVVNPIPVLPIPLTEVTAWGLTQNPGY